MPGSDHSTPESSPDPEAGWGGNSSSASQPPGWTSANGVHTLRVNGPLPTGSYMPPGFPNPIIQNQGIGGIWVGRNIVYSNNRPSEGEQDRPPTFRPLNANILHGGNPDRTSTAPTSTSRSTTTASSNNNAVACSSMDGPDPAGIFDPDSDVYYTNWACLMRQERRDAAAAAAAASQDRTLFEQVDESGSEPDSEPAGSAPPGPRRRGGHTGSSYRHDPLGHRRQTAGRRSRRDSNAPADPVSTGVSHTTARSGTFLINGDEITELPPDSHFDGDLNIS